MKPLHNIKVLVLDDDPLMLMLLTQLLHLQGINDVINCENGFAALQLIKNLHELPQLVLCDLQMPEMDGIEFIRNLAGLNYAGSVVLISGEDASTLQSARTLIEAYPISILGSLQKPVAPKALATLLDDLIVKASISNDSVDVGAD